MQNVEENGKCSPTSCTLMYLHPIHQIIDDNTSLPFYFQHKDTIWHLLQTTFKNIVTKAVIARNEQFLLLSQCFNFFVVNKYTFIIEIVHVFLPRSFKNHLQLTCWMRERVSEWNLYSRDYSYNRCISETLFRSLESGSPL